MAEGPKDSVHYGKTPAEWLQGYRDRIVEAREKVRFHAGTTLSEKIKTVSDVIGELADFETILREDTILESEPRDLLQRAVKVYAKSTQMNLFYGLKSLEQINQLKEQYQGEAKKLALLDKAAVLIGRNMYDFMVNEDTFELMGVLKEIDSFHTFTFDEPLKVLTNEISKRFSTVVTQDDMKKLRDKIRDLKSVLEPWEADPSKARSKYPDAKGIIELMKFVKDHSAEGSRATYYELIKADRSLRELSLFCEQNPDVIVMKQNFKHYRAEVENFIGGLIEKIKRG